MNTRANLLQALQWRAQACFWAWSTQALAQHTARQHLNARLVEILGRRRRRIFERWRVWAVHAERLRAGEERAVIAGQSWRAARAFHGWHEWARCSSVCADLLRFRQHQCLARWRAAAVARQKERHREAEAQSWCSTRMLQTSIDKLWVFAAQQQRLAFLKNQAVQVRGCRALERCLSGWRLATLAEVEKHETKILAQAFRRENVCSCTVMLPIVSFTADFCSVSVCV